MNPSHPESQFPLQAMPSYVWKHLKPTANACLYCSLCTYRCHCLGEPIYKNLQGLEAFCPWERRTILKWKEHCPGFFFHSVPWWNPCIWLLSVLNKHCLLWPPSIIFPVSSKHNVVSIIYEGWQLKRGHTHTLHLLNNRKQNTAKAKEMKERVKVRSAGEPLWLPHDKRKS